MQADQSGCQIMKGLDVFTAFFKTVIDAAEVAEPWKRAFDHEAKLTQPAAMGGVVGQRYQRNLSALHQGHKHLGIPVAAVALHDQGMAPHLAFRISQGRHALEKLQGRFVVAPVARGDPDLDRQAVAVGDEVALAAIFRTINAAGPCVRPPKSARKAEASITMRRGSTSPRASHQASIFWCKRGQTPACVHSCKRRQTVEGDPQPKAPTGSHFHWQPVFKRYTMPARHARSGTRGRPSFFLGLGGGNNGSKLSHNSSGTSTSGNDNMTTAFLLKPFFHLKQPLDFRQP